MSPKASARPRKPRSGSTRYPRAVHYTVGPFKGVLEEPDPTAADLSLASEMVNLLPRAATFGSGVQTRPGWERINTSTLTGSVPQGAVQFTLADGTTYPVVFYAGKMYKVVWINGGTGLYGPSLTDITPVASTNAPVGFTISASAGRIHAIMFRDYLIVSDGVNKVWKWDGTDATYLTDGTAGSASGVAFGPLAVYYDKLFYIRADDRRMIVWSEEGDPDTGYLNTTYNNFWTLAQTDQDPLMGVVGFNEALVYFRQTSIGQITGAVRSDFSSSGTHDSISQSVGLGLGTLGVVGTGVYFLDVGNRPWRFDLGAGLTPLWEQCQESARRYFSYPSVDLSGNGGVAYAPAWGVVLIGHSLGAATVTSALVFDHESNRFLGHWKHKASDARAMYGLGTVLWASGEETAITADASGNVFRLTLPSEEFEADYLGSGGIGGSATAIETTVVGPPLGGDDPADKLWDRMTARVRALSGSTFTVSLDYQTSRATYGTAQTVVTGSVTPTDLEQKVEVGLNGHGRLIRPRVQQSTATTTLYVLTTLTVSGWSVSDEATAP